LSRNTFVVGATRRTNACHYINPLIFSTGQEQDQDQEDIDNSVFLNGENRTLEHPEEPSAERTGVIEKFTLKKDEDNEENDEV